MTKVKIEISARHCHLSKEHIDVLFGDGYELNELRRLSVPGTFAAVETVILKVGKGEFQNLRIVGPINKKTQVEISRSDAIKLEIDPPVRVSGDLDNSVGGVLVGPKGKVDLVDGIIVSQRHIHCDQNTLSELKINNKETVSVKYFGPRSVTFHDVVLRASKDSELIMHVDTDEANVAGIDGGNVYGELILNDGI